LLGNGRAAVESTLRSHLADTALAGYGFHSLRRLRATHLAKMRCSESLMMAYLGHKTKTATDGNLKIAEDFDFRKAETDRIGLGFDLK
jgi:integrase